MVKQILDNNFFDQDNLKGVFLVDFYATWCPPCKALAPVLEDISNSRKYTIYKINVDENPNVSRRFKIDTVPTLMVFKDGKPIEKSVGYVSKNEIIDLMDKHMD